MLKIISCKSPIDKGNLLKNFNPASEAWIVSDLQSKWHLQGQLLDRHSVLEEQAILRASEYWKKLAVQVLPSYRLLSAELTQSLFWHWLEPLHLPWMRTPQSLQVLLQQMRQWVSVFADPNYSENMVEWFTANPNSFLRWGQWFKVSEFIWQKCLEEKVIVPSWLPALLSQQDLSQIEISKDLIFDLGVELTPIEAMLIEHLARDRDVRVIRPDAVWCKNFHQPMYGYRILEGTARGHANSLSPSLEWQHLARPEVTYPRYSTRVAEVKGAVAQVRQWLDSGVPAKHIGLIAPDIEQIWPILDLFLQQEGIFVRKSKVTRLHSFPEMAKWLAHLRLACEQVSRGDLESALYLNQTDPKMAFDEFRILYTSVYGPQDLARSSELAEKWSKSQLGDEPMNQDDFFMAAAKYWSGGERSQGFLEKFAQTVTQDCPADLKLKPEEWLNYWQGVLARIEVPIREELSEGIWCVSLSSTDWLNLSHGVFLNMSASDLRPLTRSPIPFSELEKLSQDLGYPVDSPDRQQMEFEFLWLAERDWTEFVGSFAQTDVMGTVLTPSRLWLWGGHLKGKIAREAQSPEDTRWDEIQRLDIGRIGEVKKWPPSKTNDVRAAVERDHGAFLPWPHLKEWKASANSLEKYFDCPFIFAAQKIFHLTDSPTLDLDIDRMSDGKLMHALFAKVVQEPFRREWTDTELTALIEECAVEEKIQMGEKGLWPVTVRHHLQLVRALLAMELEWRAQFPRTKTLGNELPFEAFLDLESGAPTGEPTPVRLTGRIDRIDGDGKNYLLIDYKSSLGQAKNVASWAENETIQLSLYSQVIEAGLTSLPAGPVESAQYYVPAKRRRNKGYFLSEAEGNLFDPALKMHHSVKVPKKKLDAVREEINQKIATVLSQMAAGNFDPHPKDLNLCNKCRWSLVCRSPHLN